MSQLLTDLNATRALIATTERWTQGAFARDSNGLLIAGGLEDKAERATCFCLDGAIRMATGDDFARRNACQAALLMQTPGANTDRVKASTWTFNDTHTHAEVLELLDRAISVAGRQ